MTNARQRGASLTVGVPSGDGRCDHTPDAATPGPRWTSPAAIGKLVVAVVAVGAFVIFAWQNWSTIDVEFLTFSFDLPLFVLMVLSALVGIVVWELAALVRRRRRS